MSLPNIYKINIANANSEGTTGRTLTTGVGVTGGGAAMTVALCTSACQAANFIYAGVEYAGECCKSKGFKSRLLLTKLHL